jgi:hypothetical protein
MSASRRPILIHGLHGHHGPGDPLKQSLTDPLNSDSKNRFAKRADDDPDDDADDPNSVRNHNGNSPNCNRNHSSHSVRWSANLTEALSEGRHEASGSAENDAENDPENNSPLTRNQLNQLNNSPLSPSQFSTASSSKHSVYSKHSVRSNHSVGSANGPDSVTPRQLTANMTLAGLGTGIISLPYNVAGSGLINAFVITFVVLTLNFLTNMILVWACEKHQIFEQERLLEKLPYGKYWKYLANFSIWSAYFICLVGYIIAFADSVTDLAATFKYGDVTQISMKHIGSESMMKRAEDGDAVFVNGSNPDPSTSDNVAEVYKELVETSSTQKDQVKKVKKMETTSPQKLFIKEDSSDSDDHHSLWGSPFHVNLEELEFGPFGDDTSKTEDEDSELDLDSDLDSDSDWDSEATNATNAKDTIVYATDMLEKSGVQDMLEKTTNLLSHWIRERDEESEYHNSHQHENESSDHGTRNGNQDISPSPQYKPPIAHWLICSIAALIVWPLSFLSQSKLALTSTISIFINLFIVSAFIYNFFMSEGASGDEIGNGHENSPGERAVADASSQSENISDHTTTSDNTTSDTVLNNFSGNILPKDVCLFGWTTGSIGCVSAVLVIALNQPLVPPMYGELQHEDRTPRTWAKCNLISSGVLFVFFMIFASFGYATYGENVHPNITTNLSNTAW